MIQYLSEFPLLLLFVVASLGYLIGSIKIKGSTLGVAAVLFTGLAFGALDPSLQIPEIVFLLGLSLFVYSIGLSSGPAFFKAYRKNGFKDFGFIISMLIFSGIVSVLLWFIFGFSAATIAGAYAGSTTNTPALAGVIDYIGTLSDVDTKSMIEDAVVGYTFSYPMGVLGSIAAIIIMEKVLRIDYEKEKESLKKEFPLEESLSSANIEVTNKELCDVSLRDLFRKYDWKITFGRIYHDNKSSLVNWDTRFQMGDIVMLVGSKDDLEDTIKVLGKRIDSSLEYDRKEFDVRRIFVSNSKVVGRKLSELRIDEKFNAVVTRIRRGDVEMLAKGDTVLEQGDRIRFIARREDLEELSKLFGDSYRESSTVNLFSFGLGIGLGLFLGSIEFSISPTFSFKLGYAGGPLVVALILGALRRTGPIVWSLPYSANVTLQQIGLILFLATIGVRSGHAFVDSLSMDALWIFAASAIISLLTAIVLILVGYKFLNKPFSFLIGMVANQPAILDFATSRTGNTIPVFGYVMIFPIALISKIVIAQILFIIVN
jgi:putative transport protein